MNKRDIIKQQSDFILYTSNEGKVNIEVFLQDETIWLTQKTISELYGVQRPAITKHLKNIFDCGELQEDSVSSILEHTASDGKILKSDVAVAKNYLSEAHIMELNQIVSAYLDLAEN